MNLKLIVCEVFYREVCALIAESPHKCDAEYLPKGLHDLGTDKMSSRIQAAVTEADTDKYDAVILVYGLCNNGLAGIHTEHIPLVIPRAHDCMTLFMGGRSAYTERFNSAPGTYYRTTGWIERQNEHGADEATIFDKLGLSMKYDELVHRYGEENADYIMETMGGEGVANYDTLGFIRMGLKCEDAFAEMARDEAVDRGWAFNEIEGSMSLLHKLISGDWDEDFLVCKPGEVIVASHDAGVVSKKNK